MGEGQLLSVGMSLTAHKQLNGMSMCLSTKLCNPIVWACRIIGADVQGKRSRTSFFSLSILSLKFFLHMWPSQIDYSVVYFVRITEFDMLLR